MPVAEKLSTITKEKNGSWEMKVLKPDEIGAEILTQDEKHKWKKNIFGKAWSSKIKYCCKMEKRNRSKLSKPGKAWRTNGLCWKAAKLISIQNCKKGSKLTD